MAGEVEMIELLLANDAEVSAGSHDGFTACGHGELAADICRSESNLRHVHNRSYAAKQERFPMGIVNLLVASGADAACLNGSEEVLVRSTPEHIFELLCDVTRMGEWSPECFRCEWLGDAVSARHGARFRGQNRRGWMRWSTECTVTHYEPYRVFGFETKPPVGKAQSRWRFDLEPNADGTVLRESFEVLWYVRPVFGLVFGGQSNRLAQLREGVLQTLERIKRAAEAT